VDVVRFASELGHCATLGCASRGALGRAGYRARM
jgi:hypothetical protein